MRIAIISTELLALNQHGALEQLARDWGTQLQKYHDVKFVSVGEFSGEGQDSVPLENHEILKSPLLLHQYCESNDIEICIFNNRPGWSCLVPRNITIFVVFHNYASAWRLSRYELDRIPNRSLNAIVMSQPLSDHIEEEIGNKILSISLVHPHIADEFIEPRKQISCETDEPTLLFASRIMYKKGVWAVLDAMDYLGQDAPRIDFLLNFSPNPIDRHFTTTVLARIKRTTGTRLLPRAETPSEMRMLYESHKGVVVPSVEPEGLGLIGIESLATSTPTLVSGLGGLRESVERGAYPCNPLHIASFGSLLRDLAENRPMENPKAKSIKFEFSKEYSFANFHRALLNHL